MKNFNDLVWEKLKEIPQGKITTYKELARAVGFPYAARAVGNALHNNPHAPHAPCHRVLRSDGSIGGYAGGVKKKQGLLKKEGVLVIKGKVLNFNETIFRF